MAEDNRLNLFITANTEGLKAGLDESAAAVRATIDSIKSNVTSLPAITSAAVGEASTAFLALNPAIQEQSSALLNLKSQLSTASAALKETETVIRESGGAAQAGASILRQYAAEQTQVTVLTEGVSAATKELRTTISTAVTAQQQSVTASTAQAAGLERVAAATAAVNAQSAATTTGLNSAAAAALKEAEAFTADNEQISAYAARVLELGLALKQISATLAETKAAFAGLSEEQAAASGISEQYSARLAAQAVLQNELTASTEALQSAIAGEYATQQAAAETLAASYATQMTAVDSAIATMSAETIHTDEAVTANRSLATSVNESTAAVTARTSVTSGWVNATQAEIAAEQELDAAIAAEKTVRAELIGVTQRTEEQENRLAVAETRRLEATRIFNAMESERTRQINLSSGALGTSAIASDVAGSAYLRLATATVAHANAQQTVRDAMELATSAAGREQGVLNELALAQQRAAAAGVELAAAQKEVEAATDAAGSSFLGFRARVIAGENGMRAFITTGLTSLPLLAGVLATTFAVRSVNAIKETELELTNLAHATGETVDYVAELGKAAEANGAKSDDMSAALRRLSRTVSDAASGSETARLTLRELGVDMAPIADGIVPKLSTVIAQMSDYLHINSGNAEIMRASFRGLGTDSAALVETFGQGSQALRRQMEEFGPYGVSAREAESDTRELQRVETELGATWDQIKLKLLEFTAEVVRHGQELTATVPLISQMELQYEALARVWRTLTASGLNEYMTEQAKLVSAPPKPPEIALTKTPKPTKEASDLPEFREELAQKEAAFEGSHLEMLRMEDEFWSNLVSTGRVKSRDLITVQTEIARAAIAIHKEENAEALASMEELASLDRQGSAQRVTDEQNVENLLIAQHRTGTKEFDEAEKNKLIAVRDRVSEELRVELESIQSSVASTRAGSQERVDIYAGYVASLKGVYEEINAQVQSSSGVQQRVLQGELDFVTEFTSRVTKMYDTAETERTAALQREAEKRLKIESEGRIDVIKTQEREDQLAYQSEISRIDDLAAHELISARTKISLIEQVQSEEHKAAEESIRSQITVLQAEQAHIKTLGDIKDATSSVGIQYEKLGEQIKKLFAELSLEETKYAQKLISDQQRATEQMLRGYTSVFNTIEQGFNRTIDGMLRGTLTFGRGMQELWNNLVIQAANTFAKLLLDTLKYWLASKILAATGSKDQEAQLTLLGSFEQALGIKRTTQAVAQDADITLAMQAGIQRRIAQDATGAAEQSAVLQPAAIAEVQRSAGTGGAAAFASVIEALPYPENVATAPPVAGAVVSLIEGYGATGGAAQGALLGRDTIVGAHAGEAIFSAADTAKLTASFPSLSLPGQLKSGVSALADTALTAGSLASQLPSSSGASAESLGAAVGGEGGPGGAGGKGGAGATVKGGDTNIYHGNTRVDLHGATKGEMAEVIQTQLAPMLRKMARSGELKEIAGY